MKWALLLIIGIALSIPWTGAAGALAIIILAGFQLVIPREK